MLTGEQIRAARALLKIEQTDLAERAGVSAETVRRFEAADGVVKGREDTVRAVKGTLEALGVSFIDQGEDGGVGVRRKQDTSAIDWNAHVEAFIDAMDRQIGEALEDLDLPHDQMEKIRTALETAAKAMRKQYLVQIADPNQPALFPADLAVKLDGNMTDTPHNSRAMVDEVMSFMKRQREGRDVNSVKRRLSLKGKGGKS